MCLEKLLELKRVHNQKIIKYLEVLLGEIKGQTIVYVLGWFPKAGSSG